jgi:branched-chain amino acid transport system substrate-binding protein
VVAPAKALLFPASVEAMGDRGRDLSTEVWWSPHQDSPVTYPLQPQKIAATSIPLAAGAERYYREHHFLYAASVAANA